MSRKDFVAIAAAINSAVKQINRVYAGQEASSNEHAATLDGVKTAAQSIADACADSNPRFDRARFLAACGIN